MWARAPEWEENLTRSGPIVGIREVANRIRPIGILHHDLEFFDVIAGRWRPPPTPLNRTQCQLSVRNNVYTMGLERTY